MIQERTGAREHAVGVPACFLAGVLVGVLGTFKHQFGVSAVTRTGWPIGLVASVLMVALLLAALRLGFPSRWFASAAAVGVLGAVVVLGLPGPSGSEVILQNWVGTAWTIAPVVVAAAVVGWPRRRPPRPDAAARPDGPPRTEILADGPNEGMAQ